MYLNPDTSASAARLPFLSSNLHRVLVIRSVVFHSFSFPDLYTRLPKKKLHNVSVPDIAAFKMKAFISVQLAAAGILSLAPLAKAQSFCAV